MKSSAAKLGFGVLLALGLSLGEAGLRSGQEAHADEWKFFASNTGSYCEGCCTGNFLCCSLDNPCSIRLDEDN
jgi:hypothetical protein